MLFLLSIVYIIGHFVSIIQQTILIKIILIKFDAKASNKWSFKHYKLLLNYIFNNNL